MASPATTPIADLDSKITAYRARQTESTPASVLQWLRDGNERFVQGKGTRGGLHGDARERVAVSASKQAPLAMLLSCVDARTCPETAFDVSCGDLFTCRIATNVVNEDVIASIEVCVASGAEIVVIMGHTDCGGIKGAFANFEFGHLTQLLARVRPAFEITNKQLDADPEASKWVGERDGGNTRYVAKVSFTNARRSAQQVYDGSEYLQQRVDAGEVWLMAAQYDVETGRVTFDEPFPAKSKGSDQ